MNPNSFALIQVMKKIGKYLYISNVNFTIGCSANHFFFSSTPGQRYVMRIGLGSSEKKFQRYRPINDPVLLIFVFGSIIMGKEPLTELKFAIFKN